MRSPRRARAIPSSTEPQRPAGLGNAVGALVFVGCAYWFLYGRAAPGVAAETVPASRTSPAREPATMPATAQG